MATTGGGDCHDRIVIVIRNIKPDIYLRRPDWRIASVNAAAAVTIAADAESGGDLMGSSVDHPVSFDRIGWATGNRPLA